MTRPRALLIVADFPPVGGVGVMRAAKMAKYLPEFGFDVEVVTTEPRPHLPTDPSLLPDVATATIHRVPAPFPHDPLLRARAQGAAAGNDGASRAKPSPASSAIRATGRAVLKYSAIPDPYVLWARRAARHGTDIARRRDVDVIWSTHQPASAHLAAAAIQRATGLPWIADYRDPWTWSLMYEKAGPVNRLERRWERRMLAHAAAIVTVTKGWQQMYRDRYGDLVPIVELIYNGFDPDDIPEVSPEPPTDRLRLAYAGSFHWRRSPLPLLQGIAEGIRSEVIDPERLELVVAGRFDPPGSSVNSDAVVDLRLQEVVHLVGRLPHDEVMRMLSSAHVAIDIGLSDAVDHIPAKLFEYVGLGRPILGVHDPGEAADLIEDHHLGWVVGRHEPHRIAELIGKLQEELPDPRGLETSAPFDRRRQAESLAGLMRTVSRR